MIQFMKLKWVAIFISFVTIGGSFFMTFNEKKGFTKDLDFAGGIKITMKKTDLVKIDVLREFFKKNKIEAKVQLAGKGKNSMIKIEIGSHDEVLLQKKAKDSKAQLAKLDFSANSIEYLEYLMITQLANNDKTKIMFAQNSKVGPTFGEGLFKQSVKLLLITLLIITFYVSFRFRFKFAVGAMLALVHDLFVTLGLIGWLEIPLSIPVIAALLTILGYSINDTIVIFDRIRENIDKNENYNLSRLINLSITESLTRTIITSITTLIAVGSVYFFGGESLEPMALVLILGIIVGTYSSSFIASPVLLLWNRYSKS